MKWLLILYTLHASEYTHGNFTTVYSNPDNPIKVGLFETEDECIAAVKSFKEINFDKKYETIWPFKGICVQGSYP